MRRTQQVKYSKLCLSLNQTITKKKKKNHILKRILRNVWFLLFAFLLFVHLGMRDMSEFVEPNFINSMLD
jgi:Trk-type K+ transport system membrane component